MTPPRIGVATRNFRQPLRRALETAGRIGADAVQIDLRTELPLADCSDSAVREIRKRLEDYRLTVDAVVFPTRRGFADENDLQRRVVATAESMTVARRLGASVVINRVGPVPDDASDEGYDRLVESLTHLGRHGERVGARLAMQAGADSAEQLTGLLERVPEQTVGVDFHPAELLKRGDAPADALEMLASQVLHVTAADAVHDLGSRRVVDVALGRGMVDTPVLLAQLEALGYRGPLTIDRPDSEAPAQEIRHAIEYLRTVLRDA